jgi:hypothetical protein
LGLNGCKVLLIHRVHLIWGEEEEAVRILASIVLTDEVVSASPWFMAIYRHGGLANDPRPRIALFMHGYHVKKRHSKGEARHE